MEYFCLQQPFGDTRYRFVISVSDHKMAACLGVAVALCLLSVAVAYNNGAANSLLPPLGWSSWVALGPGSDHPIFDYCDEFSVKASVDAFIEVGLYDAGYRHFHLDDCWAGGRNASGYLYAEVDHFPNGMVILRIAFKIFR